MLANIFWLILGILATSAIFFTGGQAEYNPTVLNVSAAIICDGMFIFSSLLANNQGKLFKKIFGY
jgi:hypothetical protein